MPKETGPRELISHYISNRGNDDYWDYSKYTAKGHEFAERLRDVTITYEPKKEEQASFNAFLKNISYLPHDQQAVATFAALYMMKKYTDAQLIPRDSGATVSSHSLDSVGLIVNTGLDGGRLTPLEAILDELLHDVPEDALTKKTDSGRNEEARVLLSEIRDLFGDVVGDGVDAISKVKKLGQEDLTKAEMDEQIRTNLFELVETNPYAVLARFGERYHNLLTLNQKKDKVSARNTAQETLDVYVPLGKQLGIPFVEKMEILALNHLHPDVMKYLEENFPSFQTSSQEEAKQLVLEVLGIGLDSVDVDPPSHRELWKMIKSGLYEAYMPTVDFPTRVVVRVENRDELWKKWGKLRDYGKKAESKFELYPPSADSTENRDEIQDQDPQPLIFTVNDKSATRGRQFSVTFLEPDEWEEHRGASVLDLPLMNPNASPQMQAAALRRVAWVGKQIQYDENAPPKKIYKSPDYARRMEPDEMIKVDVEVIDEKGEKEKIQIKISRKSSVLDAAIAALPVDSFIRLQSIDVAGDMAVPFKREVRRNQKIKLRVGDKITVSPYWLSDLPGTPGPDVNQIIEKMAYLVSEEFVKSTKSNPTERDLARATRERIMSEARQRGEDIVADAFRKKYRAELHLSIGRAVFGKIENFRQDLKYIKDGQFNEERFTSDIGLGIIGSAIVDWVVDNYAQIRKSCLQISASIPPEHMKEAGWAELFFYKLLKMGVPVMQYSGGEAISGTYALIEFFCEPLKGFSPEDIENLRISFGALCRESFGVIPSISISQPVEKKQHQS